MKTVSTPLSRFNFVLTFWYSNLQSTKPDDPDKILLNFRFNGDRHPRTIASDVGDNTIIRKRIPIFFHGMVTDDDYESATNRSIYVQKLLAITFLICFLTHKEQNLVKTSHKQILQQNKRFHKYSIYDDLRFIITID